MNELSKHTQSSIDSSELVMNIVIKAIRSIYPAWRTTVKSQQELDNMKGEWLIAFQENRINTDTQINRGLERARRDTNPYLPSVGQFIEWCRMPHQSHQEFKGLEYQSTKSTPEFVRKMIEKCNGFKPKENKE